MESHGPRRAEHGHAEDAGRLQRSAGRGACRTGVQSRGGDLRGLGGGRTPDGCAGPHQRERRANVPRGSAPRQRWACGYSKTPTARGCLGSPAQSSLPRPLLPEAWPGSGQMVDRGPQEVEFIPGGAPKPKQFSLGEWYCWRPTRGVCLNTENRRLWGPPGSRGGHRRWRGGACVQCE